MEGFESSSVMAFARLTDVLVGLGRTSEFCAHTEEGLMDVADR